MADAKSMIADMKAAAEVEVQKYVDLQNALDADLKAATDAGFDDGVKSAGNVNAADKLYSEAELQEEIAPLKAQIAKLQESVDAQPQAIADAVAGKIAEIKADYGSAKVDDRAFEAKYFA